MTELYFDSELAKKKKKTIENIEDSLKKLNKNINNNISILSNSTACSSCYSSLQGITSGIKGVVDILDEISDDIKTARLKYNEADNSFSGSDGFISKIKLFWSDYGEEITVFGKVAISVIGAIASVALTITVGIPLLTGATVLTGGILAPLSVPIGVAMVVTSCNSVINACSDVYNGVAGIWDRDKWDKVGEVNVLRDSIKWGLGELSSAIFGESKYGETIGSIIYYGIEGLSMVGTVTGAFRAAFTGKKEVFYKVTEIKNVLFGIYETHMAKTNISIGAFGIIKAFTWDGSRKLISWIKKFYDDLTTDEVYTPVSALESSKYARLSYDENIKTESLNNINSMVPGERIYQVDGIYAPEGYIDVRSGMGECYLFNV